MILLRVLMILLRVLMILLLGLTDSIQRKSLDAGDYHRKLQSRIVDIKRAAESRMQTNVRSFTVPNSI